MALPGNGIFVVKGEMSVLLTAMRRGNRWGSSHHHHHHHQDGDQDPLAWAFLELRDTLNRVEDLRLVDPIELLQPFLEVIRSEDTTGPVTSLALSAVNKFLSYGLIDPTHVSIPMTVHSIADAVTHARFVGTDQTSDGVVLMKILQVLKTLTLSPEGSALTNESLCDIMLSCFKICFETRLSELLRRTAEHYLKDMIQLVFMRLPQFPEVFTGNLKKMRPSNMEQTRTRKRSRTMYKNKNTISVKNNSSENKQNVEKESEEPSTQKPNNQIKPPQVTVATPTTNIVDMQGSISQVESAEVKIAEETADGSNIEMSKSIEELPENPESVSITSTNADLKVDVDASANVDYVNQRGIRFTPQHPDDTALLPYGLACVYELFRFLISLCNPMEKQNTEVMIHLGLTLLTTAFEVGADSIGKYSSLLGLVKDELCRNLFSLLSTERLSVFAADLQVSFLMFEALRTHLKFQLEHYLTKLIEIVVSDGPKVTYEHKEISLDNILQLWRIPGFTAELYLNYDCDMYCTNLFEDLTKLLAKNAFPMTSGVYHTHLLSLDALLTVIESIESHFEEKNDGVEGIQRFIGRGVRQRVGVDVPSREELLGIKNIKKWLPTGTEYFNHKPKKGIQFLQEHGVLKPELDATEVVIFLRENPALDKKMIGEFISGRSNINVLQAFVGMFDFTDTRIDEALRLYLETFRLPGEAPLISMLLEYFAEHWHKCNGEPFANADAAFTLAYAVIMLNVDQHNHNVKRQNNPMTPEEFKKNLKKVNGGADFEQDMLDEIYVAIKGDEIVMPAEQTGLVRENYLWKVLLRRGASKDGRYVHVNSGHYDQDLFALIWGPIVAALSFVFDKSDDPVVFKRALHGFERCARISSYFGLTANLDMVITTLSKYTTLHNQPKLTNLTVQFGLNAKAQMALKAVFALSHQYGENIREGWKNLFDLILTLFMLNLLPKTYVEADDFIETSGKIRLAYEEPQLQKPDAGLFSSIYSYMVSSENISKVPTPEEQECIDAAKSCVKDCGLEQVITDSKFLHEQSLLDLTRALIELSRGPDVEKSLGYGYNESVTVFFLELLIKIVLQNRDRVMTIWQMVRDHLYTLVMNACHFDYQFLLERSVIGLLRLAIRLMRNEDMSPVVLQSLRMLLLLKDATLHRISRQISYGLYELLKTSAQNIHTSTDWSIVFTLLECVGAGAQPPKPIVSEEGRDDGAKSEPECAVSSEEESLNVDKGYTSDSELTKSPAKSSVVRSQSPIIVPVSPIGTPQNNAGGWILVGNEGEIQPVVGRTPPAHQYSLSLERNLGPHDPSGLVKCCESLAFLVRDVAHITPYNFDNCVHCIRTFVEASLQECKQAKKAAHRDSRVRRKTTPRQKEVRATHRSPASSPDEYESEDEDLPGAYHQVTIQLLDLMHTLHTRTAQIFRWWAEEGGEVAQGTSLWTQGWCPLLQGIARLCCDNRKLIRMNAITYLQRALLVHDLQTLTGPEWEACFNRVLFPLLTQLLQPIGNRDPTAMEETRMRAATVLSKVFLHHLTPLLSLETFPQLWLTILDYMDKYMHADKSDLLAEAIPESLKNMLLVMESAGVFEGPGHLWTLTWDRIGTFLPRMKEELFLEKNGRQQKPAQSPAKDPEFPRSTIQVTQHNVENATRSSIILQPPGSQHGLNSPLFAHLGQMVSTPIGPPPQQQQPQQQHEPPIPPTSQTIVGSNAPHTFPVLYGNQTYTLETQPQPVSLYAEYLTNPYSPPSLDGTFQPPRGAPHYTSNNQRDAAAAPDNSLGGAYLPPDVSYSGYNQSAGEVAPEGAQQAVLNDDSNGNPELEVDLEAGVDKNSNGHSVFQSANYFMSDQSFIPPGSEILYGGQVCGTGFNSSIPMVSSRQNVDGN